MKETYSSPEMEALELTSKEHLANDDEKIDFDSLLADGSDSSAVKPSDSDIDVPLFK